MPWLGDLMQRVARTFRAPSSSDRGSAITSRVRYELFFGITTEIILFCDQRTLRILDANDAASRAYGYSRAELRELHVTDLRLPGTEAIIARHAADAAAAQGTMFETVHVRKDGTTFPVEVLARTAWVEGERIIISTIRDTTQRHRAAHHAQRLTELWRLATDPAIDEDSRMFAMLRAGAAEISAGARYIARLSHVEGAEIVIDAVTPEPRDGAEPAAGGSAGTRFALAGSVEARVLRAHRAIGWTDETSSAIGVAIDVAEERYVLAFVSEAPGAAAFTAEDEAFVEILGGFFASRLGQARLRRQLVHQIGHDRLTALPNRAGLRQAVHRAIDERHACTLVVIDLDAFDAVNETLGNLVADAILVEVGAAFTAELRPGEFVARLEGDSFGLLLPGNERTATDERVAAWRSVFERPFGVGDRDGRMTARVTACFGAATSPDDGTTFEKVLTNATSALRAAKARGPGRIAYFDREIERLVSHRRVLRAELRDAIERDEFELYYQPTISLATLRVIGAEALLRWNHPVRGLLGPDEFIPFAQQEGSIRDIDRWVAQRTVTQVGAFGDAGDGFRCYFNLSARTIDDSEFVAWLAGVLALHPAAVDKLGVEITENAAMLDFERTQDALSELRRLGMRIAIDDFGTGYSSLAYLKRFPIDVMKIDRSFIEGIERDSNDRALVETLLAIAAQFGCATVAEGVESAEQLAWLQRTTCTAAQGYYLARPMPFPSFVASLLGRGPAAT
jgi:diguanylate cyclase (GGDEF)-like protein/PAS domain S-box-containing protein